jgi:hypothetical protein
MGIFQVVIAVVRRNALDEVVVKTSQLVIANVIRTIHRGKLLDERDVVNKAQNFRRRPNTIMTISFCKY